MPRVSKEAKALHPEEPWRWREDWASGRIRSSAGALMAVTWLLAVSFGAPSVVFTLALVRKGVRHPGELAMGMVFPLISLALLAWALVATARWRRFRGLAVELATLPGVLGGKLAGTVQLGSQLAARVAPVLTLSCVRCRRSGRDRIEEILWQEAQTVPAESVGRGYAGASVPFSFTVPYELPASMVETRGHEQVVWRLEARAELRGADLAGVFEVPVYETPESSPDITDRISEATPAAALNEPLPEGLAEEAGIRIAHPPDGGLELYFPAGRNKAGAAMLTVIAAAWSGMLLFVAQQAVGAREVGVFLQIFLVPFWAVSLLLWVFVPVAWLQRTTVRARPGSLEIRTRVFGAGRPRVLEADAIGAIAAEARGHAGSHALYAIRVHPTEGRPRTAGDGLRSKRAAGLLAAALWRVLKEPGWGG